MHTMRPKSPITLAALAALGALAAWAGTPLPLVLVTAATVLLILVARRSLRRAASRIDTILREELSDGGRDVSFLEEDVRERS